MAWKITRNKNETLFIIYWNVIDWHGNFHYDFRGLENCVRGRGNHYQNDWINFMKWKLIDVFLCSLLLTIAVAIVFVKSEYDGTEDQIIQVMKTIALWGALRIWGSV